MFSFCNRELLITKKLLENNVGAMFCIFLAPLFGKYLINPGSNTELIVGTIHSLIAIFLLTYTFEAINQGYSVEEDKINHPNRPVPCGLLTQKALLYRQVLSSVLCPIIIGKLHGYTAFLAACSWSVLVLGTYAWPVFNSWHWFAKNVLPAVNYLQCAVVSNEMLKNINPKWDLPVIFDIIITVWCAVLIPIQDFADVEGDKATGRITLPIYLGPEGTKTFRKFLYIFSTLTGVSCFILTCISVIYDGAVKILFVSLFHMIFAIILGVRILKSQNKEMDKTTYYHYFYFTYFVFIIQMIYFGISSTLFENLRAKTIL